MDAAPQLERTKAVRRKLLSSATVVLLHAALFAALAVPHLHPIRPASAPVEIDLAGMPRWSHDQQAAKTPPAPPTPAPVSPPAPAPPVPPPEATVSAPSPPAPPLPPSAPLPPSESVFDLAARLIRETNPSTLLAQLTQSAGPPPPATAPPPPAAPDGEAAASAQCEIGGVLQASLQASDSVHVALKGVPRSAKSVANAIQLWDGKWVDTLAAGGASAIDPVKAAILAGVISAPPACRQQLVTGPRFITVTSGADTTLLAVGSGVWRWADLLDVPVGAP